MSEYSMPSYFQSMPVIGKDLSAFHEDNAAEIQAVEQEIHEIREAALEAGKSTEALNESGQWTAMQRIMELVDEGTWCPLNSLYNPQDNKNGSVGIVKGLGRIDGKWAVIIASDNKKLAGAWVPGQADSLLRGSDTAKRLRIPLVYVLNCSGVKLDEQEKVYPNRRGGGTPFYRNSELNQMGVPVIVGIYGTNPAGGGYHSISPTILIAHQDANMAVGGAGIVGGMSPKGHVDKEAAEALIKAQKNLKSDIPGTVAIHYGETGFFREVYADEEGVLAGIRKYIDMLPAYDPEFFRVDDPKEPLFDANDLYSIVPFNQKRSYDMVEVLARLFDGSEFMEYKHGYGPEMITGLAKIDGLLVGVVDLVKARRDGRHPCDEDDQHDAYGKADPRNSMLVEVHDYRSLSVESFPLPRQLDELDVLELDVPFDALALPASVPLAVLVRFSRSCLSNARWESTAPAELSPREVVLSVRSMDTLPV